MRQCPLDGAEIPDDREICPATEGAMRGQLRAVPDLLDELDTSLARIGSSWRGDGLGRGGSGTCRMVEGDDGRLHPCLHEPDSPTCTQGAQLVMNTAASEASLQLRTVLHGWARVWDEETPIVKGDGSLGPWCGRACWHLSCERVMATRNAGTKRWARSWSLATAERQARTLAAEPLAGRPWAPDLARELRAAVRQAEHAIDRAPELELAGQCECGMTLYAQAGASTVQCRWCGRDYAHDRVALLAALPEALADPLPKADIARLLGMPVGTLHRWSSEGRIVPVLVDGDGRPRFDPRPIAQAVRDGIPPALPERTTRHRSARVDGLTCGEAS